MPYLNKCTVMGHLTADPTIQYTPNGTPYCNFTVGVNFRSAEGSRNEAEFYDCVAWKGWAENLVKTARKGSLVLVDGRLRQEVWTDRATGQKRSRVRVNGQLVIEIPRRQSVAGDESQESPESGNTEEEHDQPVVDTDESGVPF